MTISEQKTQILIVGAGPSGLMMAAQLLRNGIQPIIIDSKKGPTDRSKALAVQARSMEIYRQLGIVDRVISGSRRAEGVVINTDGNPAANLSFNNIANVDTMFPFIYLYPQDKNERLLLDYLAVNCCPVYWNTSLISISQHNDVVEAKLKYDDQEHSLICDWIIGADGAHSTVRKLSSISFSGDTYQHQFYLADVKVNKQPLNAAYAHFYLSKQQFAAFFPMPGDQHYRIVGSLPPELDNNADLSIEDIEPYISKVTDANMKIIDANWFSIYKLHHRMAQKFRYKRCFLIGDAAHVHSPVGGQGMNTGLQDAYNLAWKLASVIKMQMKPTILESYAAERMPVAKDLLNTTDKVFNMITSRNLFIGWFKRNVLPAILNRIWKNKTFQSAFFKRISQTGINYRASTINLHLSNAGSIKAGDRLPCLKVFDEKKQVETDLHRWCTKPGFTLIAFGKLQEFDLFAMAKWITINYQATLNFFYLPRSEKNKHVFEAFEIGDQQQKAIIVRPDMYVGFINDWIDMDKMDNYLKNVVGVLTQS